MTGPFVCVRCRSGSRPPADPPYAGELGEELRAKICAGCWEEWLQMEVMVINELRLDFMDPRAPEVLVRHLREFLCLDGRAPSDRFPLAAYPPDGGPFGGDASGDPDPR